ncbi:MAG: CehA/McbA family metallohydrolase [Oscillospiraceae bacterium]|nr:CehA/McbA family metallohydrolase [Oscillospiraceae bacterium]
MHIPRTYRKLMSSLLAAALFLSLSGPAGAAEVPAETAAELLPVEIPAVTEPAETVPAETVVQTLPAQPPAETVPPETTEATLPPETVEETLPPETTAQTLPPETTEPTQMPEPDVSPTQPPEPAVTPVTVRLALSMAAGTENITLRGTVVYLSGTQAVLQDSTGGIRLRFAAAPCASLGDTLLVTGSRSGGLYVTEYENLGPGTLPVRPATLLSAEENVRVCVRDAVLGYGSLMQGGFSVPLVASLPDSAPAGGRVDAWGVILDGQFYADDIRPAEAEKETEKPEWNHYFGLLHAHTSFSDGTGTVEEAFAYASRVPGLDFFAVTDHSDSFDNALFGAVGKDGNLVSTEWARGKAAAQAVTDGDFVGLFGYEMTWTEDKSIGHVNTFNTPGWQTRDQQGMETLEGYCEALSVIPGAVSQFNHPSHGYGNFRNFTGYTPEQDDRMHLIEIGKVGTWDAYEYYVKALDNGWHLAPSCNQNNHNGFWGDASEVRTVILAKELTEATIYEAIAEYRVYASEDRDLALTYRLNGALMGSILPPQESLRLSLTLEDPTDGAAGLVEVIGNQGEVLTSAEAAGQMELEVPSGKDYYFLRVIQEDGDIAVSAPVWVDNFEDMGISAFTADNLTPEQGQEVMLSLELFNHENAEFVLELLEIYQGDTLIHRLAQPGTLGPVRKLTYELPFSRQEPGPVTLTAKVTGTVLGAGRSYSRELTLHFQPEKITQSTIAQLRTGTPGDAFRISGYVTAGSSNPYTTFSDGVYLQDDTGGIAVSGLGGAKLEVGAPVEVTGTLRWENGNPVLVQTAYSVLDRDYYRFVPRTMAHRTAMDYDAHGGQLLQIEGKVISLTKTADGKGVSRFTLRDVRGDLATVLVEQEIRSGAYGANQLASQVKKNRTVRAIGLLHKDEYGETVLRVRNCDEVVYVPPLPDYSNYRTWDWLGWILHLFGS